MSDWFATRSGQLAGCYCLVLLAMFYSIWDHDTGKTLLNLIIGAILRDMQDHKSS